MWIIYNSFVPVSALQARIQKSLAKWCGAFGWFIWFSFEWSLRRSSNDEKTLWNSTLKISKLKQSQKQELSLPSGWEERFNILRGYETSRFYFFAQKYSSFWNTLVLGELATEAWVWVGSRGPWYRYIGLYSAEMSRCGPRCPHVRLHTEFFFRHRINMETLLGRVPVNTKSFPRFFTLSKLEFGLVFSLDNV